MSRGQGLAGAIGSVLSRRRVPIELRPKGEPKGAVLLSYITKPFALEPDDNLFTAHSNLWECMEIARTFLDRGFSVDVIDYDDASFVPKKDYAVFIDIHSNMERLAPMLSKDCLKILHATGSYWKFQNDAEQARVDAIRARRGASLRPRRVVPPSRAIESADCMTLLGNAVTASTFAFAGKPIHKLHVSSPVTFPWDESKDFEAAKKRFVWFGGTGLILKGLDIALEAFAGVPDLHLTVCGPTNKERDFADAYHKELFETKNIHTVGWVDPQGEQFRRILHETGAMVYPSASEGQSTSVVVCLHAGLVPVVSVQSGVDVLQLGRVLTECTVEEVRREARAVASMSTRDFEAMSRSAWEYARRQHTRESFSREYRGAVAAILQQWSGRGRGSHPRTG